MKLKDSDLNVDQFVQFVLALPRQDSYDSNFMNFEEGTVYLNDTDYVDPDDVPVDNEVDDDGKYQGIQSVYKYVDKFGGEVYLSHTCTRSGSYFSEYHYQDFDINVVTPHERTIVEYY